jgi:hypothetical protein
MLESIAEVWFVLWLAGMVAAVVVRLMSGRPMG